MTLKTPEEYKDSLRKIKPRAFIAGRRIDNILDHPNTRPTIEVIAKSYELALDPNYEEIFTTTSHFTGQKISRWAHVPRSIDDLAKRCQMNTIMAQKTGTCNPRCAGTQSLHFLTGVTYAMDQKLGTEYNKRFEVYLRYMEENDLSANQIVTATKGDRSKRPTEQEHADFYLRVVKKTNDGIVVRGAKIGPEGCCAVHEHLVSFSMTLRKGEEDYALCFAIPAGTEGITYVLQDSPTEAERRETTDVRTLGNPVYGSSPSFMVIFDDVFVPWERVFMCGEIEFAADLLAKNDTVFTNLCGGCCKVGYMDLVIGATQAIAEYNGISRIPHIVDKITEMLRIRETSNACALGGILNGKADSSGSGVIFPDAIPSLVAQINTWSRFHELAMMAGDIAGGAVLTMPSQLELQNPEISQDIKKYLKGVESVSTENRMRMLKFLQHWTAGPEALRVWHGAAAQSHKTLLHIQSRAGLEEKKKMAKNLVGIEE